MRLNYETCLAGAKCVLVPYRPEHVATYHNWMQDQDLLDATGSEPLSLKEEIEMQQFWRDDLDKCTFIVLSKDECGDNLPVEGEDRPGFVRQKSVAMAGDVNLFLSEDNSSDEGSEIGADEDILEAKSVMGTNRVDGEPRQQQGELNIMIARKDCRGQGMGTEAARMMMLYGARKLGIRRFFVKISEDNVASRNMFEKTLGFRECNYVRCFQEVELEFVKESADEMVSVLEQMLSIDLVSWQCSLGE